MPKSDKPLNENFSVKLLLNAKLLQNAKLVLFGILKCQFNLATWCIEQFTGEKNNAR